jgi:hypothetical protein
VFIASLRSRGGEVQRLLQPVPRNAPWHREDTVKHSFRGALTVAALATAAGAVVATALGAVGTQAPETNGTTALTGRAILPASTFRAGSAPSGAFFSAGDRAGAANNGVTLPATGPAFAEQPVQGFSALIPTGATGQYWAMSDNGYGARANSVDFQLWVNKVKPTLTSGSTPGGVEVLGGFGLSDPNHEIPWKIVCDQTGANLPPFDFNLLPATAPALCGPASERRLTGFDFDPESVQIARDGTFWFGEEFGPFLLHTDTSGRLLEAPIAVPGVTSPQNPTLDVLGGVRPTANSSKGFEGLGISPDRRTLYPLLEGATSTDNTNDLRIYTFDIDRRKFSGLNRFRTELPAAVVNTTTLRLADGSLAYPGDTAPPASTGKESIGEFTMINRHQGLIIERGPGGDYPSTPRFRGVFLVTLPSQADGRLVQKQPLVDLMAIADPNGIGGDGDFFRFPYGTIEAITPLDGNDLLIVDDNNYPFSNGRSFSKGGTPGNGLVPDDNEFIRVHVTPELDVDKRVYSPPSS